MGNVESVAHAEEAQQEPPAAAPEPMQEEEKSEDTPAEGASAGEEKPEEEEAADSEKEDEKEVEGSEKEGDNDVQAEEEPEEEEKKITADDVKTAPLDFRFPTTNQARHCFTRYNEYHKCIAEKGEDSEDCPKYAKYYRAICPGDWVDKWNEQREAGTYVGRY